MIQVLENTLTAYPLEALRLAPENTRQEADPTALEDLKASIREQGLLQNLVGYREGDQVFVVAGGHRLRALQALAEEGFRGVVCNPAGSAGFCFGKEDEKCSRFSGAGERSGRAGGPRLDAMPG